MYTFTLTPEQLQVLSMALGEIPYKHAAPLVVEINKQIAEQQKKASDDAQ